jgi:acetyltransferase-like isoleucine patch superfamily enzyme
MVTYTKDALGVQASQKGWTVGEFSYGVPGVKTWGVDGKLHIGRYCSFAGGVEVLLGGNHRTDWVTTYPFNALHPDARHIKGHPSTNGDVNIGNDVWVGQRCVILSGVTVGDGACLAAESVVTRDVPPYSIVGGNPAKIIRYRFNEQQIAALLVIKWWEWNEPKITAGLPYLLSPDVDMFVEWAYTNTDL